MRTTAEPQNGGNNNTMNVNKTRDANNSTGRKQSSEIKPANGSINIANN